MIEEEPAGDSLNVFVCCGHLCFSVFSFYTFKSQKSRAANVFSSLSTPIMFHFFTETQPAYRMRGATAKAASPPVDGVQFPNHLAARRLSAAGSMIFRNIIPMP